MTWIFRVFFIATSFLRIAIRRGSKNARCSRQPVFPEAACTSLLRKNYATYSCRIYVFHKPAECRDLDCKSTSRWRALSLQRAEPGASIRKLVGVARTAFARSDRPVVAFLMATRAHEGRLPHAHEGRMTRDLGAPFPAQAFSRRLVRHASMLAQYAQDSAQDCSVANWTAGAEANESQHKTRIRSD